MALTDSLVSYWELEETSGTRVDSHGSNDLTDLNTVSYATGKQGNAADFERGNSEAFSLALGSTGLELKDNFSVSFWFKAESLATYHQFYTSGTQANQWRLGIRSGTPQLRFTIDSIADYTAATTISTDTWYHIVYIKNGTNIKIYLDNSLDLDTTVSASVTTPSGTAYFGRLAGADGFLDGLLDEFGFWGRSITSDEVAELYNSGAGLSYADIVGSAFVPRVSFIM
jgi:hypothetical protein